MYDHIHPGLHVAILKAHAAVGKQLGYGRSAQQPIIVRRDFGCPAGAISSECTLATGLGDLTRNIGAARARPNAQDSLVDKGLWNVVLARVEHAVGKAISAWEVGVRRQVVVPIGDHYCVVLLARLTGVHAPDGAAIFLHPLNRLDFTPEPNAVFELVVSRILAQVVGDVGSAHKRPLPFECYVAESHDLPGERTADSGRHTPPRESSLS
eukprot:scaffold11097_cov31-Tisochrysis_lutea.AAC.2